MLRNWFVFIVLAAVGAANFSSLAIAQQRPARAPAAVAASNWSGFYIGGHVGYAWSSNPHLSENDTMSGVNFLRPISFQNGDSGALGGLLLGYNWQFAPTWLIGVEGDWSWTNIRSGGTVSPLVEDLFNIPRPDSSGTMHTDIRGIGSLRGRLGYVQPNWMAYVTGGWAIADLRFSGDLLCSTLVCAAQAVHAPVSATRMRSGWVLGGGVEIKQPASPWILGLEYLYYSFAGEDHANSQLFSVATGAVDNSFGGCSGGRQCVHYTFGAFDVQTVRLRLGYKFN